MYDIARNTQTVRNSPEENLCSIFCTFQESFSNLSPRLHNVSCRRSKIWTFYSDHHKNKEEGRLRSIFFTDFTTNPPSAKIWYNLLFATGLMCPRTRVSTLYLTFWPSCLILFKLSERFWHRHAAVLGCCLRARSEQMMKNRQYRQKC